MTWYFVLKIQLGLDIAFIQYDICLCAGGNVYQFTINKIGLPNEVLIMSNVFFGALYDFIEYSVFVIKVIH